MQLEIVCMLALFLLNVVIYLRFKYLAYCSLKNMRFNPSFFPKHYAMPPIWMRKHFNLKKAMVPKYIFATLYISAIHGVLSFVLPLVFAFSGFNEKLYLWIAMVPLCSAMFALIIYFIFDHKYTHWYTTRKLRKINWQQMQ